MLVISRKNGQKIMINDNIVITIVDSRNGQCKIAIDADKDVKIYREEIYYQIKLANLVGKNTDVSAVDSVSNLIKENKSKINIADIIRAGIVRYSSSPMLPTSTQISQNIYAAPIISDSIPNPYILSICRL